METSVAANGNFVGSQVNVTLTYTSKLVTNGVVYGWGNGVLMTTDGDMATYTGEAIGKIASSGMSVGVGLYFTILTTSGKLASLSNLVAVLEAEVDAQGDFSEKTWEWR